MDYNITKEITTNESLKGLLVSCSVHKQHLGTIDRMVMNSRNMSRSYVEENIAEMPDCPDCVREHAKTQRLPMLRKSLIRRGTPLKRKMISRFDKPHKPDFNVRRQIEELEKRSAQAQVQAFAEKLQGHNKRIQMENAVARAIGSTIL